MKRKTKSGILLFKLFLLALPVLFIFSPSLISGETIHASQIAVWQQTGNRPILYGTASTEGSYYYYKMESANIIEPEVLVLGSSRALQVRRMFFNDGIDDYNAGVAASNPVDMLHFLQQHNNKRLHTVILALDQIYLRNALYNVINDPKIYTGYTFDIATSYINDIRVFITRMLAEPSAFPRLFNSSYIGYLAVFSESGFLKDGSFFYGKESRDNHEGERIKQRVEDTIANFSWGNGFFSSGEIIDEQALLNLQTLLDYCKNNEIHVIAFFPPFAPTAYDSMISMGKHSYIQQAATLLPNIFDAYGFEFYDYTDVTPLGCTDNYFIDGFHGSDTAYLRMFIDMIEAGSRLGELCDLDSLKQYDANRYWDGLLLENLEAYWALV